MLKLTALLISSLLFVAAHNGSPQIGYSAAAAFTAGVLLWLFARIIGAAVIGFIKGVGVGFGCEWAARRVARSTAAERSRGRGRLRAHTRFEQRAASRLAARNLANSK